MRQNSQVLFCSGMTRVLTTYTENSSHSRKINCLGPGESIPYLRENVGLSPVALLNRGWRPDFRHPISDPGPKIDTFKQEKKHVSNARPQLTRISFNLSCIWLHMTC